MVDPISKILRSVASEMLEGLAFIFALPAETMEEIDPDSTLAASVSFSGLFRGTLVVVVSQEVLPELAANMLGVEGIEGVSEAEEEDALKELVNVVCGNLLPAIAGRREIFDIEVPRIVRGESLVEAAPQGRSLKGATKLELDEGYVSLMLYAEGDIPVSGEDE